jgi:hypothetical protein
MNAQTRTHQMMSLQQAIHGAPTLAHLSELVAQSQKRLNIILPLLPVGMRNAVRSGPLDGADWCLLVDNTAAAAKLRQMMPAMKLALEHKGLAVGQLRIKVQQGSWR